jgi:PIN domain nuclease of toxin-antitoxin system
MKVLLDTCCMLWAVSAPQQLPPRIVALLRLPATEVFVSPISCAEIACLTERNRITLNRHWKTWFNDNVQTNGWQLVDIDLAIIQEAYSLPGTFHRDPADRILVATCRLKGLSLLTADRLILDYPHVDARW